MLGSFIMRGVKLGVRWCSCSDTISIQRYHSLSLSLSQSPVAAEELSIQDDICTVYVYIFTVCLLLAVARFSSWQTYVLLIHRHATRLNFSSSALLLLFPLFFPFSLSLLFVCGLCFVCRSLRNLIFGRRVAKLPFCFIPCQIAFTRVTQ